MRKIIIASHGELSKGMLNALTLIVGDTKNKIETYCLKPGENPNDYANELSKKVANNKETEYVILTDLFGASICSSMVSLAMKENVVVFSGFNLGMVLDIFLGYPNKLTLDDVNTIITNARDGVKHIVFDDSDDDNDF